MKPPQSLKLILTSLAFFSSRYYVAGIIIGPVIFYFPKFFELRTRYVGFSLNIPVDCYLVLNQIKNSSSQGNYNFKVSYFVESSCFALILCWLFVVSFLSFFFLSFFLIVQLFLCLTIRLSNHIESQT